MSVESDGEPADADLPPGTQVGEYTIERRLGAGAFGVVFQAVHPLIGKVVAIKVLAHKFSVDPEMTSRFVAEARAVNQIRHRHIIDIFSFGALPDGRQYYVMEYLDGETFDALLAREGRMTPADALPILRGIAKALDAAHAKNIAHRDLKPENVFLASDEAGPFPKLLDFGIAKLLAGGEGLHKTRSGIAVGTPYFMSPEQARGKELDHRTDIYSFGVLCYLVLTGTYPFDGDDQLSILMQHVTADPDAPSTRAPGLPPAIDEVLLWLLHKDPAARPDNLRTAVAALERAAGLAPSLESGPIALPPRTQPATPAVAAQTQLVETPKRRPRAWVIVPALAALLVAGVAAFVLVGGSREAKRAAPPPPPPPTRVIVQQAPPAPAPAPTVIYVPVPQPAPAPMPAPAAKAKPHRPPATAPGKDDIIDVFGGK